MIEMFSIGVFGKIVATMLVFLIFSFFPVGGIRLLTPVVGVCMYNNEWVSELVRAGLTLHEIYLEPGRDKCFIHAA